MALLLREKERGTFQSSNPCRDKMENFLTRIRVSGTNSLKYIVSVACSSILNLDLFIIQRIDYFLEVDNQFEYELIYESF